MSLLITRGLGLSGGGTDRIIYAENLGDVTISKKTLDVKEKSPTRVTLSDNTINVRVIKKSTITKR